MNRMRDLLLHLSCIGILTACSSSSEKTPAHKGHQTESAPGDDADPQFERMSKDTGAESPKTNSEDPKTLAASQALYADLGKAIEFSSEPMASEAAMKLLGANPNDVKALNGLALTYLKNNRPMMARMVLQRALSINKDVAAVHNNLGQVYQRLGEPHLAVESFKRALALDKNNLSASANMGFVFLRYGNYQKAADMLERVFDSNSKDENVANNFGLALRGLKEFSEAEKVLRDAASKTKSPALLLNYAEVLVELGREPARVKQILNRVRVLSTDPALLREVDSLSKKVEAS